MLCGNYQAIDRVRQVLRLAALGIYYQVINDPKMSSIKPVPFHCPCGPRTSSGIQKPYRGGSHTVSEHLWSPQGSPAAVQARTPELETRFPRQPLRLHTHGWHSLGRLEWALPRLPSRVYARALWASPIPFHLFVCLFLMPGSNPGSCTY